MTAEDEKYYDLLKELIAHSQSYQSTPGFENLTEA